MHGAPDRDERSRTMSNRPSRPNILFITTDQQSSTLMSCAGNRYLETPAMDHLAREGVRFERAYCTNPVCLPSRFSWFTGRMPSELNVWCNKSGRDVKKVPENILQTTAGQLLKKAGYRVAYGGKVHLPGDMTPMTMGCEFITDDKRDGLAQVSADWIRQQGTRGKRPFFLSVNLVNPHDICFMGMRDFIRATRAHDPDLNKNERWLLSDGSPEMDELNRALQIPAGMSEEDFFARHCPPLPSNHQPQEDEPEAVGDEVRDHGFRRYIREHWDEKTWRLHRWAYCRLTERVDGQIKTILDALDAAGLADNTLVIFTSDHGDHDGAHKLDQKTVPYEETARIPLILRWPERIEAGQVQSRPVSNGLDILPTLCDVAGCEVPEGLLGRSLIPLATGTLAADDREAIPIEWQFGRGIVRGILKYLRYNYGAGNEQLMDLGRDPGELRNHIDEPELANELLACRAAYERLFGIESGEAPA